MRRDLSTRSKYSAIVYEEGQTFPIERQIWEDRSSYSDLTILDDESIGVLWEGSGPREGARGFLFFTRLTRDFLEPKP